jgi:uncharacterized protein (TIGR03086 family)
MELTMTAHAILVEAERRFGELVGSLDAADLVRPTPCDEWDVRALLSHTLAGIEMFAAAVDGGRCPTTEEMFGGVDLVGDDPVGATKLVLARSQEAWTSMSDSDAEVTTALGAMPAGQALAISAFATIVHGWDLAIATGQEVTELAPSLHAHAKAIAEAIVPALRGEAGSHSLFQPELPAPRDATPTRRLMAFLGREPR